MWLLLQREWVGGDGDPLSDCDWSLEVITESDSWPSGLLGEISLAGRWIISLLFFLNVPLGVSASYYHGAISSPMVPPSLLSGIHTKSPGCTVNRSQALWHQSKVTFCFCPSSSSLSTKSFLSGTWGFWTSLELGTFFISFLFIWSSAGKYPLHKKEYPLLFKPQRLELIFTCV